MRRRSLTTPLREEAERIVRVLREAGHQAYFAGGCVRDMVMGREPHDYDVATSAKPEEVMRLFPRTASVGARFGVVVVRTDVGQFEVATFRSEERYTDGRHPEEVRFASAREDVFRRDFTINGMLYDPVEARLLDWVNGREDIERRLVRTIGDPFRRFEEDRLRLLRAVRFAARLQFAIEERTYEALCRCAPAITEVSRERLRDELLIILTGPNAGRGVRLMHDTGLLRHLLPEVDALAGVEQPPEFHPEGDVLAHTCIMLDEARNPSPELAMGILLHDVGKTCTRTFRDRIRFDEHDRAGEDLARQICRRLRFSNDQIEHIASLVGNHMRFMAVPKMRQSTLKRLLALPRFDEHLELHRLDCLASHGNLDNYEFIRRKLEELSREEIEPPRLLSGHDLIQMGYTPGPLFGRILEAVREEQLEGRLHTREEAREWVREKFPLPG